jgi:hypothetical protein
MKKIMLVMMLIIGAFSFANERVDRGEERFREHIEKQQKSSDEYLSRGVKKVATEDLEEIILIKERGSRN